MNPRPKKEDPADPGREPEQPVEQSAHKKSTHKLTDEEGCHCYDGTYPSGPLPPPPVFKKIEHPEEEKENKDASKKDRKKKDGLDKAMEILDEYYEGVPLRNPRVDHGGED